LQAFEVFPPSIAHAEDLGLNIEDTAAGLDHQSMLKIPIPNTRLGTIRTASLVEHQFIGLHLTEDSVRIMMRVYKRLGQAREVARKIINFLGRDDELLLVAQDDLDDLEFQ
jgi:hypothetical protein